MARKALGCGEERWDDTKSPGMARKALGWIKWMPTSREKRWDRKNIVKRVTKSAGMTRKVLGCREKRWDDTKSPGMARGTLG
jgi:hypothetical protein